MDDPEGFLISPQVCKPYHPCINGLQYMIVDGKASGTSDFLCGYYTQCVEGKEYEAAPPTATSDRVCKALTTCSAESQYVLQKYNATRDNICAFKTICNPSAGLYYKKMAVDAPSEFVNGSDVVCAEFSKCPAGYYANYTGDKYSDVQCAKCPVGTYNGENGRGRCFRCPQFTYNDEEGATECKACSICTRANAASNACSSNESKYCLPAVRYSTSFLFVSYIM